MGGKGQTGWTEWEFETSNANNEEGELRLGGYDTFRGDKTQTSYFVLVSVANGPFL
jgi:hypothetical protein